jgi:hypothetical protein
MIQAAIRGQGVALGRQPLVSDLIESGALVAPFKQTLVGLRAYFIIESPLSAGKPQVREFAQWPLAERRAADSRPRWCLVDRSPARECTDGQINAGPCAARRRLTVTACACTGELYFSRSLLNYVVHRPAS